MSYVMKSLGETAAVVPLLSTASSESQQVSAPKGRVTSLLEIGGSPRPYLPLLLGLGLAGALAFVIAREA